MNDLLIFLRIDLIKLYYEFRKSDEIMQLLKLAHTIMSEGTM